MKPRKLYRVTVKVGEGKRMRYAERGGGTYSSEHFATKAVRDHRKLGREAHLFATECDWREVEVT